jgi:hypothetical protein
VPTYNYKFVDNIKYWISKADL